MTTEAPEALEGKLIAGRYEIGEKIGKGGWGVVHRGRDRNLDRPVAIKIYYRSDVDMRRRFERERQILLQLRHENCVVVYDASTIDGFPCTIMEYLDGELLEGDLLSPWSLERSIDITLQILAGLAHIHDFGLVHRDVKPENIMVVKDHRDREKVKIFDLGIAKVVDPGITKIFKGLEGEDAEITTRGDVLGTRSYSSPEQFQSGSIDERSDLYNVGLILYAMLAGRRPFLGTEEEVLQKHRHVPPPPLPTSVPSSLRNFVGKLLEKDKSLRYNSAKKTIHALERVLNETKTAKQTPSHASTAPRHPHGKILEELRLLVDRRGNNQLSIPATPGQYFDRVLSELQEFTDRQLFTIPADERSTAESLLEAMVHVLMDRGMWTSPPAKLTREVFWNRVQRMSIAFLVKDVDLALSAQPEEIGRSIITDLCRLGIPVIFTSMVPVATWYLAIHGASATELHDIEIDAIGSDWDRFIAGYELGEGEIRDYEARSGRSPELFDLLARQHPIDIEQRRQNHAKTIRMRLGGLHGDLAKLAVGDLAGVSDAARTVLRWLSVLNTAGDALLDPQMAAHWNDFGATTT